MTPIHQMNLRVFDLDLLKMLGAKFRDGCRHAGRAVATGRRRVGGVLEGPAGIDPQRPQRSYRQSGPRTRRARGASPGTQCRLTHAQNHLCMIWTRSLGNDTALNWLRGEIAAIPRKLTGDPIVWEVGADHVAARVIEFGKSIGSVLVIYEMNDEAPDQCRFPTSI